MATTMRKLSRLATTARAAASFSASATSRRAIDFETTLYGSRCSTYSNAHHSHCFSTLDKAIGGNISYSSIASAARELHEKDLPHSNTNYAPKDVVLYQYQACPFCNKVKGDDDPCFVPNDILCSCFMYLLQVNDIFECLKCLFASVDDDKICAMH